MVDGATYKTLNISEGGVITLPENPEKKCCLFDGWYIDEDLLEKFNATQDISQDIVVYAKWSDNHTVVEDSEVPATCTTAGLTAGKHCSVCGEVLQAQTEIPALGHDLEHHDGQPATCTEKGWKEYDTCKRVGCGYTTYQEIPALGHKYSQEWSNDKTYHWHASTCGHDVVSDKGKHTFDSNWVCTECAYVDTGLHGVELRTNTLELDGTDIFGKVSNATSTFSFINEIAIADSATYIVSTDINGSNVIRTKTVSLGIGDNTFYILVENGKDLGLYTVVIRRRPMYSVSFNVNGGTSVSSQTIEEDHFATEPTTERKGYTFDKWDYDFSKPIIKDTTITASWNIITYNVYYDLNVPSDSISQDVDNSMNVTTYTVEDAITFQTPSRKGYRFTGWDKNIEKGTTGDVTVTASWEVIEYDIIYDFGDSKSVSKATNNKQNPNKYTIEDAITFAEPSRGYYTFSAWNIDKIVPGTTETQTIVASWIAEQHTINYVLSNGWTNSENNITAYTIEDKTITLYDAIKGESLFCGWYLDEECKNYIATIDASTMCDYTVYAYADDSATKGLSIEKGIIKGYVGTSTTVVMPSYYKGNSVTSIGKAAFGECTGLTSVTIPDSVTSIGYGAFSGGSGLTSITVADGNTKYHSSGNCLIETASKTLILGCKTSVIPSNGSVTSIGKAAFGECTGLTSVTIGNSVTSIGAGAFNGCSGLTSITIPDSVTSIGAGAFESCTGLMTVNWNATATSAGSYDYPIFKDCSNLATVNIGYNVKIIPSYAFYNCTGLTSITIPDSVTSIGTSTFYGCNGLTSVTIGNSVTSIATYAFFGCYRLIEVYNKSALSITAGSSSNGYVASYAKNVYTNEGGSKLATDENGYVIYTDGDEKILVAYLGTETELALPSYITKINQYAFYNCTGLTSVTIGNSVTSIGNEAFSGCTGLTSITFNGTIKQWNAVSKGYYWKNNVPSDCKVICKDGTVSI